MTPDLTGKVTTLVDKAEYDSVAIENIALRQRVAELERELTKERQLHEIAKGFHDVAIKERDHAQFRLAAAERDAARYRVLRRGSYQLDVARTILNDTPDGIDAAVDALIEEAQR